MATTIVEKGLSPQENELKYGETWPDERSELDERGRNSRLIRSSQRFKVVFPIGDGHENEKSFELALQTARRFSGTLELIYLAKPFPPSSGLLEYAKVERIMDFEWRFYESLANARLESLGQKAKEAGVRWQGSYSFMGMRDLLKSYSGSGNTLVVINGRRSSKNENINGHWKRVLRFFGLYRPEVKAQILLV